MNIAMRMRRFRGKITILVVCFITQVQCVWRGGLQVIPLGSLLDKYSDALVTLISQLIYTYLFVQRSDSF
jgi:hypothetical protein